MLETMVMTGKINKELWEKSNVVVCEDFLNSISDAYKERKNKIITLAEIQDKFQVSRKINPVSLSGNTPVCELSPKNEGDNPQTKVDYTKINKTISPEAINMANLLLALHRDKIDPKYTVPDSSLTEWASDIDQLHSTDGRDWEEIERVIKWVKNDSFWASNIMSGFELRKKFSQILAKMIGQQKIERGKLKIDRQTTMLEMEEG